MFHYFHIIHAFLLLSSSSLLLCSARDMITMSQVIRDGETIVSKGEKFKLGFFTPDGAKPDKRYVGIWYHGLSQNSTTVVWVANKENPLPNSKGYITIGEGNLKVLDERENIFWITKVSSSVTTISAKLLDSGNLILTGEGKDDDPIWQSFLNDYNTFLPGMTMDTSKVLQSWANEHDPAPGSFIFKLDISQRTRHIVKRGPETYWRSQSSDDFTNSKAIPNSVAILLSNFNSTTKKDNITPPFPQDFNNTRLIMHSTGQIRFYNWSDLLWFEPSNNCSLYNACGTYGICNSSTSNLVCECLKGFKPKSQRDWDSGEFSEGCTTLSRGCTADDFLSLKVIKVVNPDDTNFDNAKNMEECRRACLHECKCNAFSFEAKVREGMGNTACHLWLDHDLKDLEEDTSKKGQEIWVRVPRSNMGVPEISHSSRNKKSSSLMIVITIATVVTVFSGAIICIFGWRIILTRRMPDKRKAYRESTQESLTFDGYDENARDLIDPNKFGKDEDIDVPLFSFESIVAATKDFSKTNKLGQGGFGPVYKGKLLGGQEIAVKRLSRSSGQGLVEFKNEVILIAKLQHRNLVKLLGYSTKGHEKILVYEYMPNKSLDSFIFDQSRCSLLNWEKRFNIIMGIARGLLYLHQDSRLTIIHRDLKTSNILLDEEMNPKISDFGLARIFGGNQTAANTNRVAGTYGYMSPEYALDGIFSAKSDVFSFGVVLLEIISGKKITDFQSEHSLNLIGYAWELWKEDKVLDFMDKSLSESYNASEVSKCINVGLLCVQDNVDDRPTMANIIFMLGSETTTLPTPKEPAFVARKYCPSSTASSSSRPEMYSYNELSITEEQGR